MKAGFFETDITPPVGMEKPGGYGKAYCSVRHDPLKVRAGVFGDDGERVALVGIDTCVIGRRTVAAAREAITATCGICGDHVLIGASHTHSGGPLFGIFPDAVAAAPQLVRELALEHSTVVDPFYHEWVVRQISTAVCEADRRREEALSCVGRGADAEAVFNRRLRMTNGRTFSHPGKGNPDILEPAGPVDPEVGVLAAWSPGGELLGCVVNYACHGTTSPGGISADWIYYLEQTIRGVMGEQAIVVFLNGACGDVTQVNNLSTRARESGEAAARRVGTRVGAEVLKVLVSAPRGELQPVTAGSRTLTLQRRVPNPASLRRSHGILQECPAGKPRTAEWTFAKERVVLDYLAGQEPSVDVEVQAVQVGPAVFLANPAEYFCALGFDIKRRSPFPFTFVVELANDGVGYVPDEEAFESTGGGYETLLTSYSNLLPAAGMQIADASVELAEELSPGDLLPEPQVEKTGAPWPYGDHGPELD